MAKRRADLDAALVSDRPDTEQLRNAVRAALNQEYRIGVRFETGASGRSYAVLKSFRGGLARMQWAMTVVGQYWPRGILERYAIAKSPPHSWEALVWLDPSIAEFKLRDEMTLKT